MIGIILIVLFAMFLLHQFWYRRLNLPPGPMPLPLIGNMHLMWNYNRFEHKFIEWREQYGPIYTMWIGPMPIVTVNEYNKAVEMFVKDAETYSERTTLDNFIKKTRGGVYGIIDTNFDLYREQRRFTLKVLRDFGLGKNVMQDRILEEIQYMFERINKDIDSGVEEHEFRKHTDLATGSNAVANGYRFTENNKEHEFYRMNETTEKITHSFNDPIFILSITSSFMTSLPIFRDKFQGFLDGIVEDHLKNNDYKQDFEPRDYIDAFLLEMNRCEEKGEKHYFSRGQLRGALLDLWLAGWLNFLYATLIAETTAATITWGIAYLICNPETQQKLHEELDKVIGSDRLIVSADKTKLPYTQAVIMETQRVSNVLSSNIPRKIIKDVEIDGYHLKKGTTVIPQISTIMIDPNVFSNPREFNPSRFIDSNGQFQPAEQVVPFSLGRRSCMGESLARNGIFSAGKTPPTLLKYKGAVSLSIDPYTCKVERRFK
ncbi:(pine wood nematode) hypothetical protein [Aphelenchoides bicaudatus]|nr:(pine wood nematode) hypothetical protein [Aphelenchoides bicaudatus]